MAELSNKEVVPHEACDKQVIPDCIDSDVKEVLNELLRKASQEISNVQENDKNLKTDQSSDISDFVETNESSFTLKNEDLSETGELEHVTQKKRFKKRTRSVSENDSEGDTEAKDINRRKFGSEGAILSICESIIPLEKQKELNAAIDHYIEKLIKDSIFKAVKSVAVDNLIEKTTNDLSARKDSLGAESENDFILEQRLTSNSISELVELESTADSNNENIIKYSNLSLPSDVVRINEEESSENDLDDGTFGGYLADLEDTASIDDLKSTEESLNSSTSSNLEQKSILRSTSQESPENVKQSESFGKTPEIMTEECADHVIETKEDCLSSKEIYTNQQQEDLSSGQQNQTFQSTISLYELSNDVKQDSDSKAVTVPSQEKSSELELCPENVPLTDKNLPSTDNSEKQDQVFVSSEKSNENVDLIVMSPEECLEQQNDNTPADCSNPPDLTDNLPEQNVCGEEQMKINWKVGRLHVKLPHKTRGKTNLKAWKKRRVVIQPDEFVNDPKNPSLVIGVYGNDSKKHETCFWHSVSSQKAVVFRSCSRTQRYAFTISDSEEPIIHLSADKESTTQEWMAAIRAVLWPPSPFMELEKMLSGREFEVSIIDNDHSYRAGLLGMYGYLSITPKKLILLHPQQGYVIQEWYLNTVDKFHFVPQPKSEDMHKVLCMTTCSDSSTGQGEIIFFCNEAVTFLQSLASNIHQVLSYHSKQEGGKYRKELEEIAEWLIAPPQDCLTADDKADEHYKVPPRQVKSLLDIPNFIFNKSLSPVASAIYPAPKAEILEPLEGTKNKPATTSHDSGISTCTSNEDFLNCSVTSFVIGGGPMTGKSSDSELSDAYTPPRTPELKKKTRCEVLKEKESTMGEA